MCHVAFDSVYFSTKPFFLQLLGLVFKTLWETKSDPIIIFLKALLWNVLDKITKLLSLTSTVHLNINYKKVDVIL